jgi:hypothetical protein
MIQEQQPAQTAIILVKLVLEVPLQIAQVVIQLKIDRQMEMVDVNA